MSCTMSQLLFRPGRRDELGTSLFLRACASDRSIIPVVRLHGAIMAGGSPFRQNLNLGAVAPRWREPSR